MFGYIKPSAAELKVREFELYKSFYCGLCKTMGKKISRFSRLTLSYDMVFLALLRVALSGENVENVAFRCKLKPAKKRHFIKSNEALVYCACAAATLSYYKYKDDLSDTKNKFKRFLLKIFFPPLLFFSHIRKKSRKYYPELEAQIAPPLTRLSELEKHNCQSIDQSASCFAELMENIVSFGLTDPKSVKTARMIGRSLGRWLYITDALDDFERDLKNGEYNPLVAYYGVKANLVADIDMIKFALTSNLSDMRETFSLFGNSCVTPIVLNIIELGLYDKQEQILSKLKSHK